MVAKLWRNNFQPLPIRISISTFFHPWRRGTHPILEDVIVAPGDQIYIARSRQDKDGGVDGTDAIPTRQVSRAIERRGSLGRAYDPTPKRRILGRVVALVIVVSAQEGQDDIWTAMNDYMGGDGMVSR